MQKPNYQGALVVIDMTKDFVDPQGAVFYQENLDILPNIVETVEVARNHDILIIYIRHSHRKDKYDEKTQTGRQNSLEGTGGDELHPDLVVNEKEDYVLQKRRYSSFYYTDLDLILREHNIQDIYITGTKTNNCVRSTVEDAYHLNYKVHVISDCVATNDQTIHEVHLNDIDRYYGNVITRSEFFEKLRVKDGK